MKISCKHQKLIEKRIPFYNDFTGDESIDVSWEWWKELKHPEQIGGDGIDYHKSF